jgi:hypothetical protein
MLHKRHASTISLNQLRKADTNIKMTTMYTMPQALSYAYNPLIGWLVNIGLNALVPMLLENGYDYQFVKDVGFDNEDLDAMGISKRAERKKLLIKYKIDEIPSNQEIADSLAIPSTITQDQLPSTMLYQPSTPQEILDKEQKPDEPVFSKRERPQYMQLDGLNGVPQEVAMHITEYLPFRDCHKLCAVNHSWDVMLSLIAQSRHSTMFDNLQSRRWTSFRTTDTSHSRPVSNSIGEYIGPRDIFGTSFVDSQEFTLAKHENKIALYDIEQFRTLNDMQYGYIHPFEFNEMYFIIPYDQELPNLPDGEEINEEYRHGSVKQDPEGSARLKELLYSIHALKYCVLSSAVGSLPDVKEIFTSEYTDQRRSYAYNYKVFSIMDDGTVWEMNLTIGADVSRYIDFNE